MLHAFAVQSKEVCIVGYEDAILTECELQVRFIARLTQSSIGCGRDIDPVFPERTYDREPYTLIKMKPDRRFRHL